MFAAIRRYFRNKFNLKPLVPDWSIPNPDFLWIAKKGQDEAGQVSLSSVEAALNVRWTEVVLANAAIFKKMLPYLEIDSEGQPQISQAEYIERLNALCANCNIRWLDDEIGWVVTLRPGKTIEKGFMTCYTGVMSAEPCYQFSSYTVREYYFGLFKTEQDFYVIDAKHYGNAGRLFPFLLEENQLENFAIDPGIKNKIALANLKFQFAYCGGFKLPCVYAPETITAPPDRELLLGLNYSSQYLAKMLQKNKVFKFLDKNTLKPIDPSLYPQKY
ncbi:MAG: SET domain-containing protein [Gammaproteobacteria bacterium]